MRLVPVLAASMLALSCASSASYKYVKPELAIPKGKIDGLTPAELELEAVVQKVVSFPECGALFGDLVPHAIIVFKDFPELTFTSTAEPSGCRIERGTKPNIDYVLTVDEENAAALLKILEDGKVTDEEKYRVYYVTYMPGLLASFRANALYDENIARALALPPVIHMTLLNPSGYEYRGSKAPRTATASLNSGGVWEILEGHQGTAGMRVEATVEKLEEQMRIVNGSKELSETDRLRAFKAWLDSVTVK